jgi:putative endopeptidase
LWNGTGFEVDWWTPEATTNFDNRTQCLIDQYNTFAVEDTHVNGAMTLGENIAGWLHILSRH